MLSHFQSLLLPMEEYSMLFQEFLNFKITLDFIQNLKDQNKHLSKIQHLPLTLLLIKNSPKNLILFDLPHVYKILEINLIQLLIKKV